MDWLHNNDKELLLIGVDGCGGAGKSTWAEYMLSITQKGAVVHMDDFYFPSRQRVYPPDIGGHFDWKRMLEQVLEPLSQNRAACYQCYDWDNDELAEWHDVSPSGVVVIEGCYAARNELRPYYDYTVWVDCPRGLRLQRGLKRDGEDALSFWLDWMKQEDRYQDNQQPRSKVDWIIDGTEKIKTK
ncbi:uridine kinase family protein [Halobacillus naozhouensis]|uniref:Uridine kinase n=1 Tax=Halobacillus naozhouensis TaxID=554880 RepID=A0ABY8J4T8_9BACI|nr:uridine kinase [Halobacillus naozhouensis]WFT75770.1 uridine kinase [Halobacillus naozhouensis]